MKEGDNPSLSAPLLDAGRRRGMRIVPGFRPIARPETPTPPLSKEQEESISADLMKAAEELAESASKLGDELGDFVEAHVYGNDNSDQNEDPMTQPASRTYTDDVATPPRPSAPLPDTRPSLAVMAMSVGGEILKAGVIALIAGVGTAAGGAAWHKMTGKARQQAARKNAAYAAGGALAGMIGGWFGAKNI